MDAKEVLAARFPQRDFEGASPEQINGSGLSAPPVLKSPK